MKKITAKNAPVAPTDAAVIAKSMTDAMKETAAMLTDSRQELYKQGTKFLYSREKLNYTTILRAEQTYMIMKPVITKYVYEEYWCDKKLVFKFSKETGKFEPKIETIKPIKSRLADVIETFMELLISEKGQGRKDLVDMIRNAQQEMGIVDRMRAGAQGFTQGGMQR